MKTDILQKIREPIFYLTNDVGRGIGLENILPNYHIISLDDHPLVDYLQKEGVSVFCLERTLGKRNVIFRSSSALLSHRLVLSFIKKKSQGATPHILFFKPQKKIEYLAEKFGFNLIGNLTQSNRIFEDKLSFLKICWQKNINVPSAEIADLQTLSYKNLAQRYGETLVVQFGRGWAGNSTFLVNSETALDLVKKSFGPIKVKVGTFVKGLTVLNNAVIFQGKTFFSKPAVQIRANQILTSTQSGTGGRQWPAKISLKEERVIAELTQKVGKILAGEGYRGFFGLDFLIEEKTGKIFVSECNARLTASVPFYTKLELKSHLLPLLGYHLLSFLPLKDSVEEYCPPDLQGGEIVARNTEERTVVINGFLSPGIYDENLKLIRKSFYLDSEKKNHFWLTTVASQRKVNPEIEILRINTFGTVCDKDGNLAAEFWPIVKRVKEKLKIKIC